MIKVTICNNKKGQTVSFEVKGHAQFAESGSDIICAAVSFLIINTINSIETFTEDHIAYESSDGYISFEFLEAEGEITISPESKLLIDSMVFGLKNVIEEYGNNYMKISVREV